MTSSRGRMLRRAGLLLVCSLAVWLSSIAGHSLLAGSPPGSKAKQRSNAEAGRIVFNGKGVCHYCHGVDGRPDQLPQLDRDTASVVARISPVPVDLRNVSMLKLKSDKERFRAIREGHAGTGMLPDTKLTNREINDTLAYLALLRREGAKIVGESPVPHTKEQP